jgi:hypothetical protein
MPDNEGIREREKLQKGLNMKWIICFLAKIDNAIMGTFFGKYARNRYEEGE